MPFVHDVCPRVLGYYGRGKMNSTVFSLAVHSFTKYRADTFYPTFMGSGASAPIDQVIEPADNTERFKKKFLETIFSANSGPSSFIETNRFLYSYELRQVRVIKESVDFAVDHNNTSTNAIIRKGS